MTNGRMAGARQKRMGRNQSKRRTRRITAAVMKRQRKRNWTIWINAGGFKTILLRNWSSLFPPKVGSGSAGKYANSEVTRFPSISRNDCGRMVPSYLLDKSELAGLHFAMQTADGTAPKQWQTTRGGAYTPEMRKPASAGRDRLSALEECRRRQGRSPSTSRLARETRADESSQSGGKDTSENARQPALK